MKRLKGNNVNLTALVTLVTLSLLVGCVDNKTSQRALSAQEYLANSIKIEAGQPSKDQIQDLYDEMDFQRAVQAYI